MMKSAGLVPTAFPKLPSRLGQDYLRVVHESPHYLCLAKPPFTICQDESGNAASLAYWIRRRFPRFYEPKEHPFHSPKGVHRLDALVTGCTLFGTSIYGTRQISNSFKNRTVSKKYLAIMTSADRDKSCLEENDRGKVATEVGVTYWTVLRRLKTRNLAQGLYLCLLQPREGRKHQLRIHAAHALHAPILFDPVYGHSASSDTNRLLCRRTKEDGIALHCAAMSFAIGLAMHEVSCLPPSFGLWHELALRHSIDWQEILHQVEHCPRV